MLWKVLEVLSAGFIYSQSLYMENWVFKKKKKVSQISNDVAESVK